jgi:hypothetical protein
VATDIRDRDRLYTLLPAVYQELDARRGFPLRRLLQIIGDQAIVVHDDIERLLANFFIETSEGWVVPYIGDLVGNRLLHSGRLPVDAAVRERFADLVGPDLRLGTGIPLRSDVAKTIGFRRRKGTLPMLESLARAVTGWDAHAVEFFELLIWNQNLNHLREHSLDGPDIRRVEPIDRLNGPFDSVSHTVDVRPIGQSEGWYNIKNIGFFLWRLRSYPMIEVTARQLSLHWLYHFSPLGHPAPLFASGRSRVPTDALATEVTIRGPIRRAAFHHDLERYGQLPTPPGHTDYYGFPGTDPEWSFSILRVKNGTITPIPPDQIRCMNIEPDTTGAWPGRPVGPVVGVDVRNGRIAFGDFWPMPPDRVEVFYHYGFSAEIGGGPYERQQWLARRAPGVLVLTVRQQGLAGEYTTIKAALSDWATVFHRPNAIISIADNRSYPEDIKIELADGRWLVIEAASLKRPHLIPTGGEIVVNSTGHPGSELTLSGLLVEGGVYVEGELGRLRLLHTTLVPGRALDEEGKPKPSPTPESIIVESQSGASLINERLQVEIAYSIVGALRIPEHAAKLWVIDSIIDGVPGAAGTRGTAVAAPNTTDQPGPTAHLERVTIFGRSYFRELELASEVIFGQPVRVSRKQAGCVRFSYVAPTSVTPRRYRCQPDLEIESEIAAEKRLQAGPNPPPLRTDSSIRLAVQGWLVPTFTSDRYGLPGYGQLRLGTPVQIRTGAENGSEMGVFSYLQQPQREANLRTRLEEYLPFGLDAGFIFVT